MARVFKMNIDALVLHQIVAGKLSQMAKGCKIVKNVPLKF